MAKEGTVIQSEAVYHMADAQLCKHGIVSAALMHFNDLEPRIREKRLQSVVGVAEIVVRLLVKLVHLRYGHYGVNPPLFKTLNNSRDASHGRARCSKTWVHTIESKDFSSEGIRYAVPTISAIRN